MKLHAKWWANGTARLEKESAPDGGEPWIHEERIYSTGRGLTSKHEDCRTHLLAFGNGGILKTAETDDWCKDTLTVDDEGRLEMPRPN